jgi:hypothetical protein
VSIRGKRLAIGATAGILILLAAIVLARTWLAERAAEYYLASRGIEDAALDVTRLDFGGAEVRNARLGDSASARRLEIRYDLSEGAIGRVTAEGVDLSVAWRDGALDLGPLAEFLAGAGTEEAAPASGPRPEIALSDLSVDIDTAEGVAHLNLPGTVDLPPGAPPVLNTPFSLSHPRLEAEGRIETAMTPEGVTRISGELARLRLKREGEARPLDAEGVSFAVALGEERFEVTLQGAVPDLGLDLAASGDGALPAGDGDTAIDLRLRLTNAARLGEAVPETGLQSGTADLHLTFRGRLPLEGPGETAAASGILETRLDADLVGDGRHFESLRAVLDARTDFSGTRAETEFGIADILASGLNETLLPEAVASPSTVALLGPDVTLTLSEGFRLRLDRPERLIAGETPLSVEAGGRLLLRSAASADAVFERLVWSPDGISAQGLSLAARDLTIGGQHLRELDYTGDLTLTDRLALDGRLEAAADRVAFGGVTIANIEAEARVDADGVEDRTDLGLSDVIISAGRIETADGAPWTGPFSGGIDRAAVTLGPCAIDRCAPMAQAVASGPLLGQIALPAFTVEGLVATGGPEERRVRLALPGTIALAAGGVLEIGSGFELAHPALRADGRIASEATGESGQRLTASVSELILIQGDVRTLVRPEKLELTIDSRPEGFDARLDANAPELGLDGSATLSAPWSFDRQHAELHIDAALEDAGRIAGLHPTLPAVSGPAALNLDYRGGGGDDGELSLNLDTALRDIAGIGVLDAAIAAEGTVGAGGTLALEGRLDTGLTGLDAGGVAVDGLRLQSPFTVSGDAEGTAIRLRGGTLRTEGVSAGGGVRIPGPVTARVNSAELRLGPCTLSACDPAPGVATANLDLDALAIRTGETPGPIRLTGIRASLRTDLASGVDRLDTDIAVATVEADGMARLDGLSLAGLVNLAGARLDQRFTVDGVAIDPALLEGAPPLALSGRLTGPMSAPEVTGEARSLSGPELKAEIALDGGTARISLGPTHAGTAMSFLQKFTALEADAVTADGTVAGDFVLPLSDGGGGRATVRLSDVSLLTAEAEVSGVNGTVDLASLSPLRTPQTQTLRIGRLEAGVPLTDITAAFDIDSGPEGAKLHFSTLSGEMLEGRFAFEPFSVTAPPRDADLRLGLDAISLAELTQLLGLGGVSMDGELSGVVPVTIIGGEQIAINDARLSGGTNGVLRISTDRARQVLGDRGGEQVDLMLKALENFRYTKLEIGIDKAPEGAARIEVRLEGRNPDLLDAHPFVFNINVEGNADRLAETILTVYRASSGVIQTGVRTLQ